LRLLFGVSELQSRLWLLTLSGMLLLEGTRLGKDCKRDFRFVTKLALLLPCLLLAPAWWVILSQSPNVVRSAAIWHLLLYASPILFYPFICFCRFGVGCAALLFVHLCVLLLYSPHVSVNPNYRLCILSGGVLWTLVVSKGVVSFARMLRIFCSRRNKNHGHRQSAQN
jgi:hypothetical protein